MDQLSEVSSNLYDSIILLSSYTSLLCFVLYSKSDFKYTQENLSQTIETFADRVTVSNFVLAA